jgi:hypothetical protein
VADDCYGGLATAPLFSFDESVILNKRLMYVSNIESVDADWL